MARKTLMRKECDLYKDETPSRHVTKILWSRDNIDSYANREFFNEMEESCSETERTVSSCSWGFDEYEIKATKRINASLDAIEEALYEGTNNSLLNSELYDECQKWSQKFPHLRLKGNELVPINADETTVPLPSESAKHIELNIPKFDGIEIPERDVSVLSEITNDNEEEELIFEDSDSDDNTISELKNPIDNDDGWHSVFDKSSITPTPSLSTEYITNKVIEKLASKVWSEVLLRWGKSRASENSESNDYLPPIVSTQEMSAKSTLQKSWTRGKTPKTSDFPKLDGILTVSPKVLQKRPESRIRSGTSQRSRPNTGVSVMSYSSIGSFHNPIMPKRIIKSLEKTLPDALWSKKTFETESEFLNPYLPVVEENGPFLQNKLIGDLPIKDSLCKLKLSDIPIKPTFLPPIDDKDVNWNSNPDIQRPISYESHLPGYKKHNQSSIYTRHLNKISVRPSTTKTSWDMRNPNLNLKKDKIISPVENRSLLTQKNLIPEHMDNLVNLFPIVTSLEPKQTNARYKNQNLNRKNSIFGAFHPRSKR